jgi:hypothetical protein
LADVGGQGLPVAGGGQVGGRSNVNQEFYSFLRHFAQVVERQRSRVCVFKILNGNGKENVKF